MVENCLNTELVQTFKNIAGMIRAGELPELSDDEQFVLHPDLRSPAPFCIQTAILQLKPDLGPLFFRSAMELLHQAAKELSGDPRATLFSINDDPEVTDAMLIALVEKAALLADLSPVS